MLDQRSLWQSVIGEFELSIPKTYFNLIKNSIDLISISGSKINIGVKNIFFEKMLQKPEFKDALTNCFINNGIKNPEFKISIITFTKPKTVSREVTKNQENSLDFNKNNKSSSVVTGNIKTITQNIEKRSNQQKTGLNPRYTFESFIVGSSNDFAYNASQAVADNPGKKYNPLFLYSGVGLGKTHLIQAIGNFISEHNPEVKILYTTIENFTNEFVNYIRFKDRDFAKKYRNVDVLMIDDMQFIANKEKIQEEFFHTFNTLFQSNKQIIITSDRPPREIPTLSERLRSRFECGMIIDIQMPDIETRCAILEAKAAQFGVELEKNVVEYLANNYRTNIRELEGGLNQLLAFSEMRGIEPSIEVAMGLIDGSRATRPKHLTINQILNKTANFYQVNVETLKSASRAKEITEPRHVAMYLLRNELHLSFPKIAQELGRKDHTTAIYSIQKINKEYQINNTVREAINSIRESLYA